MKGVGRTSKNNDSSMSDKLNLTNKKNSLAAYVHGNMRLELRAAITAGDDIIRSAVLVATQAKSGKYE
ncbi:hypothetical protein ACLOJK_016712 [Asimina triloba]